MSAVVGQSRFLSALEAVANVVVGYALAVLAQFAVFPAFGLPVGLSQSLEIGAVFTALSLLRGYALRRLFNALGSGPFRWR
ncbi:MAG: hypothetical protein AAF416_17080 [Pseudomonadota bacterium]